MDTARDFHDNSWRIISSILILCWIITILYNHTKGTLSLVLVPAFISIGISVYSIINPRKLWPFGLLATFWGLMYICFVTECDFINEDDAFTKSSSQLRRASIGAGNRT